MINTLNYPGVAEPGLSASGCSIQNPLTENELCFLDFFGVAKTDSGDTSTDFSYASEPSATESCSVIS